MSQFVPEVLMLAEPMLAEPMLAEPMFADPFVEPMLEQPIFAEPIEAPIPMTLVQSLCSSLKELRKGKYLMLPIRKILNINVEVTIHKENKNIYILNIGPTDFSVDDDSLYEVIYKREGTPLSEDEFIEYTVQNTLSVLKKIKIDKLNGKFTTTLKSTKTDALWTAFCQEFKDEENIVLSLNECCVCFTITKTTTNCEHSVCLDCISKLRTEAVADDELMRNVKKKNCPMCRQRILFLN
jgi:hypothetical protein